MDSLSDLAVAVKDLFSNLVAFRDLFHLRLGTAVYYNKVVPWYHYHNKQSILAANIPFKFSGWASQGITISYFPDSFLGKMWVLA